MKKLRGLVLFAMLMVFSIAGFKSEAALGTVTGLKQVDAGSNSVEIEWNALLVNGIRYEAAISNGNGWVTKEGYSQGANNIQISNLNAGSTYQVKVRPYTQTWNSSTQSYNKDYGTYSNTIDVVTCPNSNPSSVKELSSTPTSLTVSWGNVPGANAYVVQYENNSSGGKKSVQVTSNKVTLSKLSKNALYNVTVFGIRTANTGYKTRAAYNSYKSVYGLCVTPSKLKAPSIPYYWQNISEVNLRADNVPCASGYQFQVYTAKGSLVKSAMNRSPYSVNVKSSKFKKHAVYKARVRGYSVNSSGKKYYGEWSGWTYFAPQPDIVSITKTSSKLRIKWDTIDGASRYILYGSSKKDSGYKKIVTTTKTKYDLTKFFGKKFRSGKKYYFRVVAQKKVSGKYKDLSAGNSNYCWYLTY